MSYLRKHVSLEGRVALVTGAGAGLGEAIALELSALGALVGVLDVDPEKAQTLVRQMPHALALACDVADQLQVKAQLERLVRHAQGLDIVVNCAGVTSNPGMPFSRNTSADWQRTLNVNLMGAVNVCAAAREALLASKAGRIVNISSVTGVISAAYMPPYSVSKAALISFTKVLARELAPHHVTANAVCPGFIPTPLWDDLGKRMALHEGARDGQQVFNDRVQQHVPMKRPQSPEDIAACVAFLCGAAAANITGQVIGVDGGVTI